MVVIAVMIVVVIVAGEEQAREGKMSALALARGVIEALEDVVSSHELTGQSQLISPVSSL